MASLEREVVDTKVFQRLTLVADRHDNGVGGEAPANGKEVGEGEARDGLHCECDIMTGSYSVRWGEQGDCDSPICVVFHVAA